MRDMKLLWCWRCKAQMAMLDEAEFSIVASKRGTGGEGYGSVLAEYERITGYKETNAAAIWHHRLALYGPPCKSCGKPLRTPRAKLCGGCMAPVTGEPSDAKVGSVTTAVAHGKLEPSQPARINGAQPTPDSPVPDSQRLSWSKQLLYVFGAMAILASFVKLSNWRETQSPSPSVRLPEPNVLVSYMLEDLHHVGNSTTYTARADGRLVVIVPDEERSCGVEPQGSRTEVSTEEPFAPSFTAHNGPVKLVLVDGGSLGKYWELQQQQALILKRGRTESQESCSVTVRFE